MSDVTRARGRRLAASDRRHGSVAGRMAGCGCEPCRVAINQYKTRRTRRTAYGTWRPFVDAEPVRQHLRQLSAAGVGWERVAEVAGLPDATVSGILYGRGGRQPARRCRQRTADAILAVTASIDTVADYGLIDSTGTLRRLRALVAIGWSMQDLGQRMPGHPEATRLLIRRGRDKVTGATARAARALYRELAATFPEESWTVRRTRRMAETLGWLSPMAWDSATIDDPAAEPFADLPPAAGADVDWAAVERTLDGERIPLNAAERHEVVRRGRGRGLSNKTIGGLLGLPASTVSDMFRQQPPNPEAAA